MVNGKRNYIEWSKDELIREILALKKQKTYGLVWEREKTKEEFDLFINWEGEKTKEEFSPESKDKFPVLAEVKDKEINSDKDKPVNLLIEGDNYHSLAVLNFTHKNSVDVIYIDPPYNTGNNDFKYNDKFVDIEDGYRHSKWLSFMSKRLALAKNLLKSSGVIFVSIDDNEFAQLKLLMNDIFNESNYYGCLTWVKRTKSTNSGKAKKMLQQKVEYILVYGNKSASNFEGFNLLYSDKTKNYPHKGKLGDCRFENLEATDYGRKKRDTMKFPILGIPPRLGRRWQIGQEEATRLISENKIEIIEGIPKRAVYPEDEESTSFMPFWSHLENTGTAESGKQELSNIVGPDHGFDTVKPTNLIKRILERFDKESIVLDFFAGSGTTAHSIFEMNKEDNGKRSFILCTNNESNICSEVCYPRISKIINGYTSIDKENIEGLSGNLKYYKTDFVEAEQTDKNKRKLVDNCTEMLCIKENTFEKIKDSKKFKIFKNDKLHLGIIFDDEYIDEFVKEAEKISGKIHVYVFSHDDSVPTKEFKTIKNKVTLCPIPETILKVYRKVFKND